LQVDGFSAYLHPVRSGVLLGAGYDAVAEDGFSWLAGVQVSLFNTSDPAQISSLAQKSFGGRFSHSEVSVDHHAFHFNAQSQIAALPVVLLEPARSSDPSAISGVLQFSGALIFDLSKGLEPIARVSHSEWIPRKCQDQMAQGGWWSDSMSSGDIRRVVEVGGNFVSVSPFGIKVHGCGSNYATIASLSFADPAGECDRLGY
jgi:hypothetical protein